MKFERLPLLAVMSLFVMTAIPSSLPAQFVVSGRVTNPLGQGAYPVDIDVEDSQTGDPIPIWGDTTEVGGYYAISLFTGTYDILYIPDPATGLVPIAVRDVVVNTNVNLDATVPWGIAISGLVTDSEGTPLVNLDVDARDVLTDEILLTPSDNTDGTGHYRILVPEGTYDLIYTPSWQDSLTTYTLWGVTIQGNTVMNVTMPVSVDLSGFVRNGAGIGIPDVDLDVDEASTGRRIRTPFDNTGSDGSFLVHIPVGVWNIMFESPVGSGYADNVIYDLVCNHDLDFNVTLENGVEISGVVRNPLNQPVPNVDLDVNDSATGTKIHTSHDNTDSNGQYSIVVPPGLYDITFEEVSDTVRLAPVEVDSQTISGNTVINRTLGQGYFFTGRVTDDMSTPVNNCDLDLIDLNTGRIIYTPGDNTDTNGDYRVIVAPGLYGVIFQPAPESGVSDDTIPAMVINQDTVRDIVLQRNFNQAIVLEPTRASIFPGDQLFEDITLYNNDTQAKRVQVRLDALLPSGGSLPILPPFPPNGVNLPGGAQVGGILSIAVPAGAPPNLEVTLKGRILDFNQGVTLNVDSTGVKILDPNNPAGFGRSFSPGE